MLWVTLKCRSCLFQTSNHCGQWAKLFYCNKYYIMDTCLNRCLVKPHTNNQFFTVYEFSINCWRLRFEKSILYIMFGNLVLFYLHCHALSLVSDLHTSIRNFRNICHKTCIVALKHNISLFSKVYDLFSVQDNKIGRTVCKIGKSPSKSWTGRRTKSKWIKIKWCTKRLRLKWLYC